MQVQNNKDLPRSQDISVFTQKKKSTYKLVDSLRRLHYDGRANRILGCGNYLQFAVHKETGERHLIGADFCRDRLCPMCNWRRSLRIFADFSKVLDAALDGTGYKPVFLTLTVRNCAPEELKSEVVSLFAAWKRFCKILPIKRAYIGWFRCLEVTYNSEKNTMHPHLHAVLLARSDYFESDYYLDVREIKAYWQQAAMIDYDVIVHIERIRNKKTGCVDLDAVRKAVMETTKYTFKDSEFLIDGNDELTDYLIDNLLQALHGARLVAYGGVLKTLAAAIKAADDVDDLDRIRELINNNHFVYIVEQLRWTAGIGKYVCD